MNKFEIICEFIKNTYHCIASPTFTSFLNNSIKFIGVFAGGYLTYLYFIRDLKFSTLKEMIKNDHDGRRKFATKLIEYKSDLLGDALKTNYGDYITNEFLEKNINNWKILFNESQSLNSEIANIVHLMYQSLIITNNIINEKEKNRTHFKNDFYNYYIQVVDWLLSICQKMRLFPTVKQALKPYKKQIVFSKIIEKITSETDLKTDTVADIGVNITGVRKEVLVYTDELNKIRNPILAYSIDNIYDISLYLSRILFLQKIRYLLKFKLIYPSNQIVTYHMFRFERNRAMFTGEIFYKFYYLPDTKYYKVQSTLFFDSLKSLNKKGKKFFIIQDIVMKKTYKILSSYIAFTDLYENNMIVITVPIENIKMNFIEKCITYRYLKKCNSA